MEIYKPLQEKWVEKYVKVEKYSFDQSSLMHFSHQL